MVVLILGYALVKTVGRLHEPAKVWPLLSVRFPIKSDITLSDMNMEAMAIWVVEFSNGGTKLDRFLPKNQHTQKKLLNFENWVNGEVSKSAKNNWLSMSIFYVKNYPNLSHFFFIEEYQFRSTFFVIDIFW